ncbi:MAG: alpha amylase C-terminal domain-containing protein [Nitrospira sp.]|nr:alpha amylase C-terminal domain-containing protein [Nitrospira sp.]MBP0123541.1 alpha amylase C-terminal domain-containing protein [Nitrospira sp.]MBP0129767.1 alpha amylase C-terminal domain-containing protein [Nitrospira sp.]MBP0130816.1 alpha amylase C-terminal domain-containing protein [Nitrospira sp.]
MLCIGNFTPVPRYNYQVGVPTAGSYRALLNSDASAYGGSNLGNRGGLQSSAGPSHDLPHSLTVTLPPLSVLFLKRI